MAQEQRTGHVAHVRTHVANIERGRNLPSLEAVFRLARALGVPPADLVDTVDAGAPQDEEAMRNEAKELLQRCEPEQLAVLVQLLRLLTKR